MSVQGQNTLYYNKFLKIHLILQITCLIISQYTISPRLVVLFSNSLELLLF